jgi:hypothetical protein
MILLIVKKPLIAAMARSICTKIAMATITTAIPANLKALQEERWAVPAVVALTLAYVNRQVLVAMAN